MCAGRPSRVCDDEPLLPSSLPICWRNLPSGVNFRIWSPSLLPPSQTLPSRSTWMPCSFFTHGWPAVGAAPGGEQIAVGIELQHRRRGLAALGLRRIGLRALLVVEQRGRAGG